MLILQTQERGKRERERGGGRRKGGKGWRREKGRGREREKEGGRLREGRRGTIGPRPCSFLIFPKRLLYFILFLIYISSCTSD